MVEGAPGCEVRGKALLLLRNVEDSPLRIVDHQTGFVT